MLALTRRIALAFLLPFATLAQAYELPDYVIAEFGAPPEIPEGPISADLEAALTTITTGFFEARSWGNAQEVALEQVVQARDARAAWVLSDLMRFTFNREFDIEIAVATSRLLGTDLNTNAHWGYLTDRLMAWDVPAFPSYLDFKRAIFTTFVPGWENLFVEGDIDWRLVSWGGVLIDARPWGDFNVNCRCIPAADNPTALTTAAANWLDDDDVVFGIEVNGEARAYPRQIMEVREMVNDTLGGRDLAIPYCTLCGAAQAYFTDTMPEGIQRPIMRTSGLLLRSNKVMYDLNTNSIFDTFLGNAVTGPLAEAGIELDQATVITTDWATWKEAHPDTTVLVERLALGRDPDFRNTRDANGPIFPVGDVDPRLPVHADIIGAVSNSGTPWAFERGAAMTALLAGEQVGAENIRLELNGGGIGAVDETGADIGSHQAFWFAWSQFHPGTELWGG
ncbi:MAG: DUF3179 domain-containing (seleno)protein [Pseudomonadota bacterium]